MDWRWYDYPTLAPEINRNMRRLEQELKKFERFVKGATLAPDGATEPVVTDVRVLMTSNTNATSITDFVGAVGGQHLTVIFGDDDTTLVHGISTIRLDAETDFTGVGGDVLQFVKMVEDGPWIEIPTG